ncbi:hypothetical protein BU16DRAFT_378860 [Lophium mytilinum]|uniref:Uncharacterized protein n=1 Tax=Lophium mytilinum TaxID=390894 RepID=A0A6A6QSB7_9PEZI|nr:hypothetical protein BU16DRAFT_378860 [Lophium mytilinum]
MTPSQQQKPVWQAASQGTRGQSMIDPDVLSGIEFGLGPPGGALERTSLAAFPAFRALPSPRLLRLNQFAPAAWPRATTGAVHRSAAGGLLHSCYPYSLAPPPAAPARSAVSPLSLAIPYSPSTPRPPCPCEHSCTRPPPSGLYDLRRPKKHSRPAEQRR